MNKYFRFIALIITIICFTMTSAAAVDTSYEQFDVMTMPNCHLAAARSNDWASDKPVIIFFPGTAECTSIRSTIGFINKYGLYDRLDVNLLTACFRKGAFDDKGWKKIAQDVVDYLKPKYDEKPFRIIVDGVSFGGYPACVIAQLLMDNGMRDVEINLADGCVPYLIKTDWIKQLAASGVRVNLWGSIACSKISEKTRNMIKELEDEENVYGLTVTANHVQVLDKAIREHGLHSEYIDQS